MVPRNDTSWWLATPTLQLVKESMLSFVFRFCMCENLLENPASCTARNSAIANLEAEESAYQQILEILHLHSDRLSSGRKIIDEKWRERRFSEDIEP